MRTQRALTLIEILVGLVILGLIISAVTTALYGGFFMLKQAEFKSRTMSIATAKMQEALTKTFDGLGQDFEEGEWNFSEVDNTPGVFSWNVTVEEKTIGSASIAGQKEIPYKDVIVNCSYAERNLTDLSRAGERKTVSLRNVVPYPQIHTMYVRSTNDVKIPSGSFTSMLEKDITFQYRTAKDVTVYYYFAATPNKDDVQQAMSSSTSESAKKFLNSDTVNTRLVFDGDPRGDHMLAKAPILSQPFQSNGMIFYNVTANEQHKVNIQAMLELENEKSTGRVNMREAEVIIIANENSTAALR
jgi:prepilin-type N-terminal cleavage/methylation domain-containing protein